MTVVFLVRFLIILVAAFAVYYIVSRATSGHKPLISSDISERELEEFEARLQDEIDGIEERLQHSLDLTEKEFNSLSKRLDSLRATRMKARERFERYRK